MYAFVAKTLTESISSNPTRLAWLRGNIIEVHDFFLSKCPHYSWNQNELEFLEYLTSSTFYTNVSHQQNKVKILAFDDIISDRLNLLHKMVPDKSEYFWISQCGKCFTLQDYENEIKSEIKGRTTMHMILIYDRDLAFNFALQSKRFTFYKFINFEELDE